MTMRRMLYFESFNEYDILSCVQTLIDEFEFNVSKDKSSYKIYNYNDSFAIDNAEFMSVFKNAINKLNNQKLSYDLYSTINISLLDKDTNSNVGLVNHLSIVHRSVPFEVIEADLNKKSKYLSETVLRKQNGIIMPNQEIVSVIEETEFFIRNKDWINI